MNKLKNNKTGKHSEKGKSKDLEEIASTFDDSKDVVSAIKTDSEKNSEMYKIFYKDS